MWHDAAFNPALRLFQLGRLAEAAAALQALPRSTQASEEGALLGWLIHKSVGPTSSAKPTLVWQYDNAEQWEAQYIRSLLEGTMGAEHADFHRYAFRSESMIVVDNKIGDKCSGYVKDLVKAGSKVVLLHLGDEGFNDDCSCYAWCHSVFRNYWSPMHARLANVSYLPLGFKSGFQVADGLAPPGHRDYLWSFCGDVMKATRASMVAALGHLGPHYLHKTSGWAATDSLPPGTYRAIMDRSVFVPCPAGYCTPDSFRVCEALEAGCIPIVERRPGFDYFHAAFGPHPMPTVASWSDAPDIIEGLVESQQVQDVMMRCTAWWQETNLLLRSSMARAFSG